MPAHLEEFNLPTLNSNISLFYQIILAHEFTLKRPAHGLKKLNTDKSKRDQKTNE